MWRLVFILPVISVVFAARADSLVELDRRMARKLYIGSCTRCHRIRNPAEYAPEEWRLWSQKMSKKAKLDPAREALLVHYLLALRAEQYPVLSRNALLANRSGPMTAHALLSPKETDATPIGTGR